MDYFLEAFEKRSNEEFGQYGFKRKNRVFARVVNDVMQCFLPRRTRNGGGLFVIHFCLFPFCSEIDEYEMDWRNYKLSQFYTGDSSCESFWEYENRPDFDFDSCFNKGMELIHKYLIPFFNHADSSKALIDDLPALWDYFENQVKISVENRKSTDAKEKYSVEKYSYIDYSVYTSAIKHHNYDIAYRYVHDSREREELCKENWMKAKYTAPELVAEQIQDIDEFLSELDEIERHLDSGDTEYFDAIVKENEEKSIEFLLRTRFIKKADVPALRRQIQSV